jgi:hypothetical protein
MSLAKLIVLCYLLFLSPFALANKASSIPSIIKTQNQMKGRGTTGVDCPLKNESSRFGLSVADLFFQKKKSIIVSKGLQDHLGNK